MSCHGSVVGLKVGEVDAAGFGDELATLVGLEGGELSPTAPGGGFGETAPPPPNMTNAPMPMAAATPRPMKSGVLDLGCGTGVALARPSVALPPAAGRAVATPGLLCGAGFCAALR